MGTEDENDVESPWEYNITVDESTKKPTGVWAPDGNRYLFSNEERMAW